MSNDISQERQAEDLTGKIREKIEELTMEKDTLIAQKGSLENEKRELNARVRKISEQNTKYRSIILQNSSSDDTEFPDDKVRDQFTDLRDIIQRTAHKHYTTTGPMKLDKPNYPLTAEQKTFRHELKKLGGFESLQTFCFRGKIFELLNEWVISERTFGTKHHDDNLGAFEKALAKSKKGSVSSCMVFL